MAWGEGSGRAGQEATWSLDGRINLGGAQEGIPIYSSQEGAPQGKRQGNIFALNTFELTYVINIEYSVLNNVKLICVATLVKYLEDFG